MQMVMKKVISSLDAAQLLSIADLDGNHYFSG